MATKITSVAAKKMKCTPFLLDVAVMNPEADFKFAISVERQCNEDNTAIWKLVFDLDKKNSKGEFVRVVHVSFTAESAEERSGIQKTSVLGLNKQQADIVVKKVHPAAKKVAEGTATETDAKIINAGMSTIAVMGNANG